MLRFVGIQNALDDEWDPRTVPWLEPARSRNNGGVYSRHAWIYARTYLSIYPCIHLPMHPSVRICYQHDYATLS